MNIKKELKSAFAPPEPSGKSEFLRSLHYPKLNLCGFILSQLRFIRKRVWIASALIFLSAVLAVCVLPRFYIVKTSLYGVWIISALLPFLAMLTAAEISRSPVYGMQELEAACRFSLPQLIGARTLILGVCSLAVIAAAAVVTDVFTAFGAARSALYITTPFIVTNALSLAAFSRFRGQEGVYLSAASAFAVSLSGIFVSMGAIRIDLPVYESLSLLLCICGAAFIVYNIRKSINGGKYYGAYN